MTNLDLLAFYRKIALLQTIYAQLAWDLEVCLPEGSHELRNEQILLLQTEIHRLCSDSEFIKSLASTSADENLNEHQLHNLRQFTFNQSAISADLSHRLAETELTAVEIWKAAKDKSDFSLAAPILQKLIDLRKEAATEKSKHPYFLESLHGLSCYDVMVDATESGLRAADLENLFIPLKKGLISRVRSLQKKNPTTSLQKPEVDFDIQTILESFGFNFKEGRLDYIKAYPFCSGGQGDVRITTRSEGDFWDNLLTTLHEMGHGIYEQNLPIDLRLTPSGHAASTGFHESQSRFYENKIGRSNSFIKYLSIKTDRHVADITAHFRNVSPGAIRTSADELHYNLHIILRWEIEQGLIDGNLSVTDIPQVWNQKMQEYFGITVKNDSEGCLQDLHWFMSNFAWFPTYTLGNLIAAQLYEQMKSEYPNWETDIENGNFMFIKSFLSKLHAMGSKKDFKGTVQEVFGTALSEKPLLSYLDERYF